MAGITVSVESLLNSATFDDYLVDDSITVSALKNIIAAATGVNVTWFELTFNSAQLVTTNTLVFYQIVDNSVLHTANKISRLSTKQDRQLAKLTLSQIRRQAGGDTSAQYYRSDNIFDVDALPSKYVGDVVTDNPGALAISRPWIGTA